MWLACQIKINNRHLSNQASFELLFASLPASLEHKMSGRGKGGKGKGKTLGKRHEKIKERIGLSKPAVKRIGRRAGVQRISKGAVEMVNGIAQLFLEKLVNYGGEYTRHSKRKTIMADDINVALKRYNIRLYGMQKRK